jgi:protein-tyrosine-phosphatase
MNCLDLDPTEVFGEIPGSVNGVWVDHAGIEEGSRDQVYATEVRDRREESGWQGLYFGGVAFKYQRPVEDLARAARIAGGYMDVLTTSGPGTGEAAERTKITGLRSGAPDDALAIASGMTPENVDQYLDLADCFLVASGISESFTELDPVRVSALVEKIRAHSAVEARREAQSRKSETNGPALCKVSSVCFVCEWNEGRSPHLAYRVASDLKARGSPIRVTSAGLSQGGRISRRRREFLRERGVPRAVVEEHHSTRFNETHAVSDLVLVAELPMKTRLLEARPELAGRVMTVRGFLRGLPPEEDLSTEEAHIEDSGGHDPDETLALYEELERLADELVTKLLES